MKIGDAGTTLIKAFEGCEFKAYLPTPQDVPTIGYGHTQGVNLGDSCTQQEASQWLLDDLGWVEECVNESVDVALTQNQYDALCSLILNIGSPAFKGSTLLKLLNAGDYAAAQQQFLRWDRQKGQPLAGLTRRRHAEADLFGMP